MSWKNESSRHALASRGIRSSFDQKKQLDDDLSLTGKRAHATSYRNYRPDDFLDHAINEDGQIVREKYIEARRIYNQMESGRFREMMDKFTSFFANLDRDEKEVWAENNPEMMNWLGIHGFLQVMNTFEDWTGIPSYHSFEMIKEDDR